MSPVARSLLYAQIAFFGFLLLCVAITDAGLSHNHGFSFYGGHPSTLVPYALGFVACSLLLARAAGQIEREGGETNRRFALALRLVVLFLLLDLLTPDTLDSFFYNAHIVASVVLFLFEAVFGLWVAAQVAPGFPATSLYVLQITGGIVAGLSQLGWIALLSPGILAFQLAFGLLLVNATAEAAARQTRSSLSFQSRQRG